MKTANHCDHIWDMLKRRSNTQLTVRRIRRGVLRRVTKLHARRDQH